MTIVAAGAFSAAASYPFDPSVGASPAGADGLDGVMSLGRTIGAFYVQFGGGLATHAVGKATDSARVRAVGADLTQAQIVSQALTIGIKRATRRERPDGTSFPFPSGHTSSAFAMASVLQRHLGWTVGAPAYSVAGYVAASRIQMKRHHLSDVVSGAAIGIAAGRSVTIGSKDARFALSPVVIPIGAGVSVTWVGES